MMPERSYKVKPQRQYKKPIPGRHAAVLAFIKHLGTKQHSSAKKGTRWQSDDFTVVWLTDEVDPDTFEPLLCMDTIFGDDIRPGREDNHSDASRWYKLIATLTGKDPCKIPEFDLYSLEGSQALIEVVHNVSAAKEPGETVKTFANVAAVYAPEVGQKRVEIPKNWTAPPIKTYAERGGTAPAPVLPIQDPNEPPVDESEFFQISDDDIPL